MVVVPPKLTILELSKVVYVNRYWYTIVTGAQWLSGRVLDSRPSDRGFEPHRRHCVVSLSKKH